jgi:hypothetical protein
MHTVLTNFFTCSIDFDTTNCAEVKCIDMQIQHFGCSALKVIKGLAMVWPVREDAQLTPLDVPGQPLKRGPLC